MYLQRLIEAKSLLFLAIAVVLLHGCATTPPPRPDLPPHLAMLAGHPFFAEQCHVQRFTLNIGSQAIHSHAQQQQRCGWLQEDLQRQIASIDQRFRDNNRCVSRIYEVNGLRQSDLRECRNVQEGWDARPQPQSRLSY